MLEKFMDHINIETSKRNQVKDLRLFIKPLVHFDKRSVCNLFPNLQRVEFIQFEGDKTLVDFSNNRQIDTAAMTSTIESVIEYGDDQFSLHLIESRLCDRLVTLYINDRSEKKHTIQHRLKHMPVLKVLTLDLYNFTFTFNDLERLHKEIPSLVEVSLSQVTLVQSEMPVDITSMPLVKKIKLNFKCTRTSSYITTAYLQYFEYISKKYTHLEKLILNSKGYTEFKIADRHRLFDLGWIPFLRSMPLLDSIEQIDVPAGVNIFKKLDHLEYKVKGLSIYASAHQRNFTLDEFTHSDQAKYMRELLLDNFTLPHLDDALRYTKLVKLALYFSDDDDDTLVLNHFLKICPDTLKHLTLEACFVEYDPLDDYQCLSLISLEMNCTCLGMIGRGVEENVYKCCPNLKKVAIEAFL
ncbi:hypothetical protein K501DRAFT_284102 [Backusella circina FSU 941]|nr:hypothetical protein K501DRAFT_284102 [Backusella circina FSU 941]